MHHLLYLQDTKLANAAAWNNLGAADEDEDGQKGAEEEEEGGDPMWNTFQSRDDIEREKVSHVTARPYTPHHLCFAIDTVCICDHAPMSQAGSNFRQVSAC